MSVSEGPGYYLYDYNERSIIFLSDNYESTMSMPISCNMEIFYYSHDDMVSVETERTSHNTLIKEITLNTPIWKKSIKLESYESVISSLFRVSSRQK